MPLVEGDSRRRGKKPPIDEEDEDLLRRLQAATPPSSSTSLRLLYDDPIIGVQDSIRRIGGLRVFDYRLSMLANEWKARMGTDAPASLLIDLARTPTTLGNALNTLRVVGNGWGMVKGPAQEDHKAVVERYSLRGVPMLSEGTYTQAVQGEVENSRQTRARWQSLVTEPITPTAEDALIQPKIAKPYRTPWGYKAYLGLKDSLNIGTPYPDRPYGPEETSSGQRLADAADGASPEHLGDMRLIERILLESWFAKDPAGSLGPWDNPLTDKDDLQTKATQALYGADPERIRRMLELDERDIVTPPKEALTPGEAVMGYAQWYPEGYMDNPRRPLEGVNMDVWVMALPNGKTLRTTVPTIQSLADIPIPADYHGQETAFLPATNDPLRSNPGEVQRLMEKSSGFAAEVFFRFNREQWGNEVYATKPTLVDDLERITGVKRNDYETWYDWEKACEVAGGVEEAGRFDYDVAEVAKSTDTLDALQAWDTARTQYANKYHPDAISEHKKLKGMEAGMALAEVALTFVGPGVFGLFGGKVTGLITSKIVARLAGRAAAAAMEVGTEAATAGALKGAAVAATEALASTAARLSSKVVASTVEKSVASALGVTTRAAGKAAASLTDDVVGRVLNKVGTDLAAAGMDLASAKAVSGAVAKSLESVAARNAARTAPRNLFSRMWNYDTRLTGKLARTASGRFAARGMTLAVGGTAISATGSNIALGPEAPLEAALRVLSWWDKQTGRLGIALGEWISREADKDEARTKWIIDKYGKDASALTTDEDYREFDEQWNDAHANDPSVWQVSSDVYANGGNIGTYAVAAMGLDPADHPWLSFGVDFAYHVGFDVLTWGGASAAARGMQLDKIAKYTITHTGIMDDIGSAIAKITDVSTISDMTGITSVPVLEKLAATTTKAQVADIFTQHIVEVGGLRVTDLGMNRQIMAKVKALDGWDRVPTLFRRAVEVFPESDMYLHDSVINEVVNAVGNAWMMPKATVRKYANEAILAGSPVRRIGIMKRMMDEAIAADPKKWKELTDYWAMVQVRQGRESAAVGKLHHYSIDPHAQTLEKLDDMLQVRAGAHIEQLERRRARLITNIENAIKRDRLITFAKKADPDVRYAELRRLGFTDAEVPLVADGRISVEQATQILMGRGGPKAGYTLSGTTRQLDNVPALSDEVAAGLEGLGFTSAYGYGELPPGYGLLTFSTEGSTYAPSRMTAALEYVHEGDNLVVTSLRVDDAYRGQGVFTRMLSDLAKTAEKKGVGIEMRLGDEWAETVAKLGFPESGMASAKAQTTTAERVIEITTVGQDKLGELIRVYEPAEDLTARFRIDKIAEDHYVVARGHDPFTSSGQGSFGSREEAIAFIKSEYPPHTIRQPRPDTLGDAASRVLSAEQVAEMAARTSDRDATWAVKDALASRHYSAGEVEELKALFDKDAALLKEITDLQEDIATAMPTPATITADAQAYVDEVNQTVDKNLTLYKYLSKDEQGRFVGISVNGSEYEGFFESAAEKKTAMRGLNREVGWSAEGKRIGASVPGVMSGNVRSARRIGEVLAELTNPENLAQGNTMTVLAKELGITDADSFFRWLATHNKKKAKVADYYEEYASAARDMAIANYGLEPKLARLEQAVRSAEQSGKDMRLTRELLEQWRLRDEVDDLMVPVKKGSKEDVFANLATDEDITKLEQELAGVDDMLAEARSRGNGVDDMIAAPLYNYQLANKFRTPVPLQVIQSHYAGGAIKIMDHMQRANGRKISLDVLNQLAKRWMLAAPGTMMKVVGDEPIRMILRGYNPLEVLAGSIGKLGYHRSLEVMDSSSVLQRAIKATGNIIAEDQWVAKLPYFQDALDPGTFMGWLGTDKGWSSAMRYSLTNIARDPHTKLWLQAPNVDGMMAYALTDQGREFIKRTIGSDDMAAVKQFAEVADEHLFKLTHYPYQGARRSADLSEPELAAWKTWVAAGRTGEAPVKLVDGTEVRVWTDSAGNSTGRIYAVNHTISDMLRGHRPIDEKILNKMVPTQRPTIAAPAMKAFIRDSAGNLVRPPTSPIDKVFGAFDVVFRNNRKTIYMTEFTKRYKQLEELAFQAVNDEKLLVMPDPKIIWREAETFARRKVEHMTYNQNRTGLEWALRTVVPFAPATRDFTLYWAGESLKYPPLGAALARLQSMPELFSFPFMGEEVSVSARTMFFWLGGSKQNEDGDPTTPGIQIIDANTPSIAPLWNIVLGGLQDLVNDGVTENLPDFWQTVLQTDSWTGLTDRRNPLNSRFERVVWSLTGLLNTLDFSKVGIDGTIGEDQAFAGADLPSFLGRNPDARKALANEALRVIAVIGDFDWTDDDAAQKAYETATQLMGRAESMQAFVGLLFPGTIKFRDLETQEISGAMSEYRATFDSTARKAFDALGIPDAEGNSTRRALREKFPELGDFFGYLDALINRDIDTVEEIARRNPNVANFFVSAQDNDMNAYWNRIMEDEGIDPDSLEGWYWKVDHQLSVPLDTRVYAGQIQEKQKRIDGFYKAQEMMAQFEQEQAAAGIYEDTVEYREAKAEVQAKIEAAGWSLEAFYQLPPETPYQKKVREKIAANNKIAAQELADEEVQLLVSKYGEDYQGRSGDPEYQLLRRMYEKQFDDEGLSRPRSATTQEEKEQSELVKLLSASPAKFITQEEWEAHGMEGYDAQLYGDFADPGILPEFLAMRAKVWAAQKAGGGYDSSKFAGERADYEEQIRNYSATSPAFQEWYEYYVSPNWERMAKYVDKTGLSEFQTPQWQEWFAKLAERDTKLRNGDFDVVHFDMKDPSKAVTPYLQEMQALLVDLTKDPTFKESFEQFDEGFWSYVRRW